MSRVNFAIPDFCSLIARRQGPRRLIQLLQLPPTLRFIEDKLIGKGSAAQANETNASLRCGGPPLPRP